jgi:hypothetical protein
MEKYAVTLALGPIRQLELFKFSIPFHNKGEQLAFV